MNTFLAGTYLLLRRVWLDCLENSNLRIFTQKSHIYTFFSAIPEELFQKKRLWLLYFYSITFRILVDLGFLYLQDQFFTFRWNYPYKYACQSIYCDHQVTECYNGYRPSEKLFFWRYWIAHSEPNSFSGQGQKREFKYVHCVASCYRCINFSEFCWFSGDWFLYS